MLQVVNRLKKCKIQYFAQFRVLPSSESLGLIITNYPTAVSLKSDILYGHEVHLFLLLCMKSDFENLSTSLITPVPQKKTRNVLKYETMTNLFLGKEYPVLI